jgi:hypothetical protein
MATPVTGFGRNSFPDGLEKQPFWFSFSFYQYRRPTEYGGRTPGEILTDLGTIRLPMPNQMIDRQDITYRVENLNTVLAAAIQQSQQGVGLGESAIQAALGAGAGFLAERLRQSANQLGQLYGVAVNPFLSVLFESPSFKHHAFTWKLAPSNASESLRLNTIVDIFRYNQLPSTTRAAGGVLLAYPNIVQLTVSCASYPSTGGYFSYAFKPAVIDSFAVNFAPGGQPSFFGTSKIGDSRPPTEVEISLSLLEIEYWLQDDYFGFGGAGTAAAGFTPTGALGDILNRIFVGPQQQPQAPVENGNTPPITQPGGGALVF